MFVARVVQDSQDYGSDDEHMVSRVFFDLDVDGVRHTGLHADVKQPVGGSFDDGPLEVSRPFGYNGPLSYETFRRAIEQYYRGLVGATGTGIHIVGGSNIRMRNNTFIQPEVFELEAEPPGGGW